MDKTPVRECMRIVEMHMTGWVEVKRDDIQMLADCVNGLLDTTNDGELRQHIERITADVLHDFLNKYHCAYQRMTP